MRIVLQRVKNATVAVDGNIVGSIGHGLLLLLGVHQNDTHSEAEILAQKCLELRIFPDDNPTSSRVGKMNLSVQDVGGGILVVSQFTLLGDCHKGRRPNFMYA